MNTSAGSPLPYTRYWTCTPSGAMAMRAAPGAGSARSFDAAGAAAGGGGACLLQAASARETTRAVTNTVRVCRMRGTLSACRSGERSRVVADGERGGEPRAFDAQQVHEPGKT